MSKELEHPKPLEQRIKDLNWLLDHQQAEITGLKTYAATLAAERDAALDEVSEQARLNGMGSEREARLIAERDDLAEKLAVLEDIHSKTVADGVAGFQAIAAIAKEGKS